MRNKESTPQNIALARRTSSILAGSIASIGIVTLIGNNAAHAVLVGYWNMNEGSGTTLTDYTVYGNNGAINGSLGWVAGQSGNAGDFSLSWNGANAANFVSIPLTSALQAIGSGAGAAGVCPSSFSKKSGS